jgi:thioredoxin 1
MKVVASSEFKKEVIESKVPVLVDFFAEWCPPCKMYGPVFERVSKKFEGKIKFVKVNSDESSEIAAEFGIMSLPTTMLFKGGKAVAAFVGAYGEPQLEKWLTEKSA